MSRSIIKEIDNSGLCLGCGFCETILGKENCKMKLGKDGFFHPEFKHLDKEGEKIIQKVCPSINVINVEKQNKDERIWGRIIGLYEGHSISDAIRVKSSSGGIVSAIAVYMLESGKVDGVLHVGGDANDYENNNLKISRKRQDIIQNSSSRYAPALIFNNFLDILSESDETYCFIGKPCDIAALKNFLSVYPQYNNRIKLTISIICAGMPSFNGTKALIDGFKAVTPVNNLMYRGNGWPGSFSFEDKSGMTYSKSYNDSWGKVLNRHLSFRCKICPEGIGLLADIAIGDAWETKNGYPDFSEKDGNSLIITRTANGQKILDMIVNEENIICKSLPLHKLRIMQPFQYKRRKYAGARILAATIAKRFTFNFQNLSIYKNVINNPAKLIMKEFYGTFKRAIKSK